MPPLTRVRIVGPSMESALRNGDWVLVRRTSRFRVGDVAVMAHPSRPDLLVVKRLVRRDEGGWWVLGDQLAASHDSRHFGVVPDSCMIGRVAMRYHPLRRP